MPTSRKIALIIIIIGACLPAATLPFITEFRPVPELCLTSNFFANMGNMIVSIGRGSGPAAPTGMVQSIISIPYRHVFSIGVVLVCSGLILLVASAGSKKD